MARLLLDDDSITSFAEDLGEDYVDLFGENPFDLIENLYDVSHSSTESSESNVVSLCPDERLNACNDTLVNESDKAPNVIVSSQPESSFYFPSMVNFASTPPTNSLVQRSVDRLLENIQNAPSLIHSMHQSTDDNSTIIHAANAASTDQTNTKISLIPSSLDVLSGRGGHSNNHTGNHSYLKLIKNLKPSYQYMTNNEKYGCSKNIVQQVHDWGGRFLKKNESDQWFEVDDAVARKKASQALREKRIYRHKN